MPFFVPIKKTPYFKRMKHYGSCTRITEERILKTRVKYDLTKCDVRKTNYEDKQQDHYAALY